MRQYWVIFLCERSLLGSIVVAGGNSHVGLVLVTSDKLIDGLFEAPRKFVSFAATLRVKLWRRVDSINHQHFHYCIC